MPKYVYEALNESGEVLKTFEVWQGINEPALEVDPDTGLKVRKIISATAIIGTGSLSSGGGSGTSRETPSATVSKACGGSCRCH